MEEAAVAEVAEAEEEVVVEAVEEAVEEARLPEEPQQEEETRNSLGQNRPPSAETDKMSTASCQTSWDTYPSIETIRPLRHLSLGSISLCPLLQEKKCATGKIACAHGPIIT